MPRGGKNKEVCKKKPGPVKISSQNENNSRKRPQTRSRSIETVAEGNLKVNKRQKIQKYSDKQTPNAKQNQSKESKKANKTIYDNKTQEIVENSYENILNIDKSDGIQVMVDTDEELDYIDDVDADDSRGSNCGDEMSELVLGATGKTYHDEKQLMSNPHIKNLLNKMLDEHFEQEFAKHLGETSKSTVLTKTIDSTPTGRCTQNKNINAAAIEKIKSPSDTTIYAPALALKAARRTNNEDNLMFLHSNDLGFEEKLTQQAQDLNIGEGEVQILNNVSNFVDDMRKQHEMEQVTQTGDAGPTEMVTR